MLQTLLADEALVGSDLITVMAARRFKSQWPTPTQDGWGVYVFCRVVVGRGREEKRDVKGSKGKEVKEPKKGGGGGGWDGIPCSETFPRPEPHKQALS